MATNVFDLYARLGLDSSAFEKGLSSAKSLIGNGIATAAKIGTAALTATTTCIRKQMWNPLIYLCTCFVLRQVYTVHKKWANWLC